MLCIPIAAGETTGTCIINWRECEFKIERGFFCFRKPGSGADWDRRAILQANRGPCPYPDGRTRDTIHFVCAAANEDGYPVISAI